MAFNYLLISHLKLRSNGCMVSSMSYLNVIYFYILTDGVEMISTMHSSRAESGHLVASRPFRITIIIVS